MKVREEWDIEGLGQRIKEARLAYSDRTGKTLASLCKALKVNRSYWYQIEDGTLKTISVKHLRLIEQLLETKIVPEKLTENEYKLSDV